MGSLLLSSSRGLTFSWWGCYGLCPKHKPTKLARCFYSVLVSVSVVKALSTVFPKFSQQLSAFFTLFFQSYFCLIGPFDYIALYESLPQP